MQVTRELRQPTQSIAMHDVTMIETTAVTMAMFRTVSVSCFWLNPEICRNGDYKACLRALDGISRTLVRMEGPFQMLQAADLAFGRCQCDHDCFITHDAPQSVDDSKPRTDFRVLHNTALTTFALGGCSNTTQLLREISTIDRFLRCEWPAATFLFAASNRRCRRPILRPQPALFCGFLRRERAPCCHSIDAFL